MRRLIAALTASVVAAALAASPALGAGWYENATKLGPISGFPYVGTGKVTLETIGIGVSCDVDSGGVLTATGFSTSSISFHDCTSTESAVTECFLKGGAFVTAVPPNGRKEVVWQNELEGEAPRSVGMAGLQIWFVDGCQSIESEVTGLSASVKPMFTNGSRNGLKPSVISGPLAGGKGGVSFSESILGQGMQLLTYEP